MSEVPRERCREWLFHAEASPFRSVGGYDDVPKERRPLILGRILFPRSDGMTLQTNSIPRAIEGASFFGSRLGHDVTMIDPRSSEMASRRELEKLRKVYEAQRAITEFMERRLRSKEDVPLVEDFQNLSAIIVRTYDEELWSRSGLKGALPGNPSGE